jgi:predicted nucleic acid-binding protein
VSRRDRFVIDASVASKWFVEEHGWEEARDLLAASLVASPGSWVGPELFHVEVLNAVRKSRPRDRALDDVVQFLHEIPMRAIGFDASLGQAVASFVARGTGVHDAFYAAVCERESAVLHTADARLARALGSPGWVRLLD